MKRVIDKQLMLSGIFESNYYYWYYNFHLIAPKPEISNAFIEVEYEVDLFLFYTLVCR